MESVGVEQFQVAAEAARSRRRRAWLHYVERAIIYTLLSAGALLFLFPLWWMLSTSLKNLEQTFPDVGTPVVEQILPNPVVFQNYLDILTSSAWHTYFLNSIVMTLGSVIGQVITASLAAFAFARLRWPGRDFWFFVFLGAMMIPIQVRLIPSYIIVNELGWSNTYQGIASIQLVEFFGVFLIRQFMLNMPRELEDAARIDGCGWLRVLFQIILPNAKPALAALAIFTFTGSWNNFLWPLVVISQGHMYTIQVGLASMKGEIIPWGLLMAGTAVSAIPLFIVYVILQRLFTQGIVMSGIKG